MQGDDKYLATSEDSDTTSFSASAMCQQQMSRTIRVHANIISDLQNLDSSAGWIACQESFSNPDPDPWALIPVLGLQNSSPSLIQCNEALGTSSSLAVEGEAMQIGF